MVVHTNQLVTKIKLENYFILLNKYKNIKYKAIIESLFGVVHIQ